MWHRTQLQYKITSHTTAHYSIRTQTWELEFTLIWRLVWVQWWVEKAWRWQWVSWVVTEQLRAPPLRLAEQPAPPASTCNDAPSQPPPYPLKSTTLSLWNIHIYQVVSGFRYVLLSSGDSISHHHMQTCTVCIKNSEDLPMGLKGLLVLIMLFLLNIMFVYII